MKTPPNTKSSSLRRPRTNSLAVKSELCDFCGTCVAVCPVDCIELKETTITIDLAVCNMCLNCVKACPIHIILQVEAVS